VDAEGDVDAMGFMDFSGTMLHCHDRHGRDEERSACRMEWDSITG